MEIRRYFNSFFSNVKKQKSTFFINIIGFAISLASCVAIVLYVQSELSYDKHNTNFNNIYRVCLRLSNGNELAATAAPVAEAFLSEFPDVEKAVRVSYYEEDYVKVNDKFLYADKIIYADSTYLDVFSLNFIKGNPKNALDDPTSVILTKSFSKTLFGEVDPINKPIFFKKQNKYFTVSALIDDLPINSHFRFNMLMNISNLNSSSSQWWFDVPFHTYLLLNQKSDIENFKSKLPEFMMKYLAPAMEKAFNKKIDNCENLKNNFAVFFLQPMKDIHLNSDIACDIDVNGDVKYVVIFSILCLFLVFMACFNYINLTSLFLSKRFKEIAIRKIAGEDKWSIFWITIIETIILCLFSLVIGIVLYLIFQNVIGNLTGRSIELSQLGGMPLLYIICSVLLLGFISGIYPALYTFSVNPLSILQDKSNDKTKTFVFKWILLIFQISVSTISLICAIVILNQFNYINKKDLGFDTDNKILLNRVDDIYKNRDMFIQQLMKNPQIVDASYSFGRVGKIFGPSGGFKIDTMMNDNIKFAIIWADERYIKLNKIKLIQGRGFDKLLESDKDAVLINESAIRKYGIQNPIGKTIYFNRRNYSIIGIMADFHFESLHKKIEPLIVFNLNNAWAKDVDNYITVEINQNSKSAISFIKTKWNEFSIENLKMTYLKDDIKKL